MQGRFAAGLVVACMVLAPMVAPSSVAGAANVDEACADVTIVYARGSGQALDQREAPKFLDGLSDRLADPVQVNTYELGSETYGGARYPAVGIGNDSLQSFKNMLEADASWAGFLGGQYRDSVRQGITELKTYLSQRHANCPAETVVLGGYSQGAQVVGDALAESTRSVRDAVAFVALAGDPKLYLPEGRGPFPPACRGKEFSSWRRGNVSCFTDNGVLEARVPYMPSDIAGRVGSWCDRDDPICNNNTLFDGLIGGGEAHSHYGDDGAELDESVREAAQSLKSRLASTSTEKSQAVDVSVRVFAVGTTGVDVAIVIDTTGSMSPYIASARSTADALATAITGLRGRVSLTQYRDAGDSPVTQVVVPLTSNIDEFRAGLGTLVASGGGDGPEALIAALMHTMRTLNWKPGATKAAIVLTDASFHDPDVATGETSADVATLALAIDPLNVYPVVPASLAAYYGPLAEATAGQVIANDGNTEQALLAAVTEIENRPVVLLPQSDYWSAPGEPVSFDASRSYDPDSPITDFEWDFDADGAVDETTTTPIVEHVYGAAYEGPMEVRARSADGGVANTTATVHVSEAGLLGLEPGPAMGLAAATTSVGPESRSVVLSWTASSSGGAVSSWSILNDEGLPIAAVPGASSSLSIPDAPLESFAVRVVAQNAFGSSPEALLTVDPAVAASRNLTVVVQGPGSVRSEPVGISCSSSCGAAFSAGTAVRLDAEPAGNARFVGWMGDCLGNGGCRVTMDADRSVTAKFVPGPSSLEQRLDGEGRLCSPPVDVDVSFDHVERTRSGELRGSVEFDPRHGSDYQSRRIVALGFSGSVGIVVGTARYRDRSGYSFVAVVSDVGRRSRGDAVGFTVRDPSGRQVLARDLDTVCSGDFRIGEAGSSRHHHGHHR